MRGGYDWSFGNWVVGGVGDVTSVEVNDSVSMVGAFSATYAMTRELDWMLAARVRGGRVFSKLLVYGTGGFAYASVNHTLSRLSGGTTSATYMELDEDEDALDGFQLGVGVEWNISAQWRFAVEYIQTSLDDDHRFRYRFLQSANGETDLARGDDTWEVSDLRTTFSYRFGG